jgi:hypothetical protein
MAQPKPGNSSAAPSVTKPSSSSPSKGKSGRGSKHQHEPPFTSPHLHLPLRLGALAVLEDSRDPCLNSHRGCFEETLGGAGVTKDTHRRQRQAEKAKEKERGPAKDRAS